MEKQEFDKRKASAAESYAICEASAFTNDYNGFEAGAEWAYNLLTALNEPPANEEPEPVLVGKLNTSYGLKGFLRAQIGHPVYELKDRYLIYLKHEAAGGPTITVPFYKETLLPFIDFDEDARQTHCNSPKIA